MVVVVVLCVWCSGGVTVCVCAWWLRFTYCYHCNTGYQGQQVIYIARVFIHYKITSCIISIVNRSVFFVLI